MRYIFCLISLLAYLQIQCMSNDQECQLTEYLRAAHQNSNTHAHQWELLLCAIKEGDLERFDGYATNDMIIREKQQNQGALLAAAASTKHPHIAVIIKKLVDLGAQPNTPTIWTRMFSNSVQWSCQTIGHTSTRSLTPIEVDEERLPLDIALLFGNVEAVRALLNTGASPDETRMNLNLLYRSGLFGNETPFDHAYAYKTVLQHGGDYLLFAIHGLSATIEELDAIIALLQAKRYARMYSIQQLPSQT